MFIKTITIVLKNCSDCLRKMTPIRPKQINYNPKRKSRQIKITMTFSSLFVSLGMAITGREFCLYHRHLSVSYFVTDKGLERYKQ